MRFFNRQAPEKRAAARRLWSRACAEGVPVVSTQVRQEFFECFVAVTRTARQGLTPSQARQTMIAFAETADMVSVTLALIETATRRIENLALHRESGGTEPGLTSAVRQGTSHRHRMRGFRSPKSFRTP